MLTHSLLMNYRDLPTQVHSLMKSNKQEVMRQHGLETISINCLLALGRGVNLVIIISLRLQLSVSLPHTGDSTVSQPVQYTGCTVTVQPLHSFFNESI